MTFVCKKNVVINCSRIYFTGQINRMQNQIEIKYMLSVFLVKSFSTIVLGSLNFILTCTMYSKLLYETLYT